jgi:dienelactone hydrolase
VLFAHGSGSSRHSPRNRSVAGELQNAGLATVLVDLLTPAEEQIDTRTGEFRFDINLLAVRLAALIDWLAAQERTAGLAVGLFGASTGAGLVAAVVRPDVVAAVVSRGGRPDLAGEFLRLVRAPTLLIVGERDPVVIQLNREAMRKLAAAAELRIVPGATHLFEELGRWRRLLAWRGSGSSATSAHRGSTARRTGSALPLPGASQAQQGRGEQVHPHGDVVQVGPLLGAVTAPVRRRHKDHPGRAEPAQMDSVM